VLRDRAAAICGDATAGLTTTMTTAALAIPDEEGQERPHRERPRHERFQELRHVGKEP
jgi:hypothetical protein